MQAMRRYAHNIMAALLCMCLLISYTPLPASAAEGKYEPSVSEPGDATMTGDGQAQASTTVNVLTTPALEITSKTEDFVAALGHIKDNPTYDLEVTVAGAEPFAYEWSRTVNEVKDEGFTFTEGPVYELSKHADTLKNDTTYVYTVKVTDALGKSVQTSIKVEVSESNPYADRTFDRADISVEAYAHYLAVLTASALDTASVTYNTLQEAAQGAKMAGAWQASLANSSGEAAPYLNNVTVSLPAAGVPEGAQIVVVGLTPSGEVKTHSAELKDGKVTFTSPTLGAFALAYKVPSAKPHVIEASVDGGNGQISPAGKVEVADGDSKTFRFLPDGGYVVDQVKVDGSPVDASQIVGNAYAFAEVKGDHALSVSFKQVPVEPATKHAVSASVQGGNGTVAVEGAASGTSSQTQVEHGKPALVSFAPEKGYTVDKVTVSIAGGAPVDVQPTSTNELYLSAVEADTVVTVTFKPGVVPPAPTFTVTATATGEGTVTPESATVEQGKSTQFTVKAAAGHQLTKLTIDGEDAMGKLDGETLTVWNVVSDRTVAATFEPVPSAMVTVEASAGEGGAISPVGSSEVAAGSSLTYYLHPDEGYRLKSLVLTEKGAPQDVTERVSGGVFVLDNVQADCALAASFESTGIVVPDDVYYAVNASAGEGGSVSPAGTVRVKAGGSQTFHFLPSDGYVFETVAVNGDPVTVNGLSYTLSPVTANATVAATFKPVGEGPKPDVPVIHEIQATAGSGGTVSPVGSVQVPHGGSMSFAFIPQAGFELDQVLVDEEPHAGATAKGAHRFDNVTEDGHKVHATFKAAQAGPVEPDYYMLSVTAGENGTAAPLGATRTAAGTVQTVYAYPNQGYVVDKVMVSQGGAAVDRAADLADGTSLALTMTADTQVSVTFRPAKTDEGEQTPQVNKYTLTASATDGGSISPAGQTVVAEGGSLAYTVAAESGYHLVGVTAGGKAVTVDNGRFAIEDVRANMDVIATFETDKPQPVEPAYRTIQASAVGGGSISPAGAVRVAQGKAQTFYFLADEGHVLDGVSVNGSPIKPTPEGSYTFASVQEDAVIEASFRALGEGEEPPAQPTVHTISASASTGGTVSPSGQTKVIEGGDLLLTFAPDAGYRLADVTVDGSSALDQVFDNALRFAGVVEGHEVRATFERVSDPDPDAPVRYTVDASVTAGGGSISPAGTTTVAAGSSQTFYFTPEDGKKVESLTVNGTTFAWSALSYTLADISADASIAVTFSDVPADEQKPVVPTMHAVSASVTGQGGSVSPSGDTQVAEGGSLALTFTPEDGFELDAVTVGGQDAMDRVSADGVLRLGNITAATAVVASFKSKTVDPGPSGDDYRTVSVSAGQGGTISPAGDVRVARGASQSFTIVPEDGMRLASLVLTNEDGTSQVVTDDVTGGVYTLSGVEQDCFLRAEFEAGTPEPGDVPEELFSVQALASAGGMVSPVGLMQVAKGSSLSFTFAPDEGFELERVEVTRGQDVSDVTAEAANGFYELQNIQGDVQVKATFAAKPAVDPEPSYFKVTSAVKGGHGAISPEGQVRVKAGASQVYLLTPEAGYVLDEVTVDGAQVATDGYTFTLADVQKDSQVEASFRAQTTDDPDPVLPVTHTVSAQATPGGTVSPSGSFSVAEGSSPSFAFAADAGYRLASVMQGDIDVIDQVVDGTLRLAPVKADVVVRAVFERVSAPEPPQADPVITATAGEGGSISPAGSVRVARGASQTFSLIPEANHKVASLTVNGNTFEFAGTSYTLFDVQADATVHVTFEASPDTPAPTVHTVSASATAGGHVVPEGDVSVVEGAGLTVSFAPFAGYELYRVSIDDTTDLTAEQMAQGFYRFNDVRDKHSIKAYFKQAGSVDPVDPDNPDQPTGYAVIDASAGEGGSIKPSGKVEVALGDSQTFEFAAMEGYVLDQVLVNGQPVQVPGMTYTFDDVRASGSIRVEFKKVITPPEPVIHVISASATEGGTITPNGDVEVDEGEDASFAIAASQGYELDYLEVDDGRVEASQLQNGTYTFPNVSAPHTIRAVFKPVDPVEPELVTVRATAGAGGAISPKGDTQVEKGSSLTFYLHPDEGYRLKSLMLAEGTGNPTDVTTRVNGGVFVLKNVQGACSLAAAFESTGIEVPDDVYYAVNASAGEGGAVSPAGTVRVKAGGSQTFHFLPSDGYVLDQVLVNDQPVKVSGLSYTLESISANAVVRATFKPVGEDPKPDVPVTHAIQASAGSGGSISPSGSVQVLHGGSMGFTFIPLSGFEIDQVLVDEQPLSAEDAAKGSYRFDNVTEDGHSVRATFKAKAIAPDEPDYYALSVEAGENGTAAPLGTSRVVAGGDQTVYAYPNEGYVVDKVMVSQGSAAATDRAADLVNGTSLALKVTADTQVSVTFRPAKADEGEQTPQVKKYTLVASATAGGSISPVGATQVTEGGSLSYTAAPEEGYRLARVTVGGKAVQADNGRFTVTDVRQDMQVRAEFEPLPVDPVDPAYRTIQASAAGGGSISPAGAVRVAQGKAQTFYFLADEGHVLDGVSVNGSPIKPTPEGSYTFASVQEDAVIEASFRALGEGEEPPAQPTVHTISASASTGGTVSPSGQTKVIEGGDLLLTFTPDAGYRLANVTVDGENALDQVFDNALRFAGVVEGHEVRATFERVGAPEPDPTVRYAVDASVANGGGTVSPAGQTMLAAGSSQTFYFAPEAGKQVKSLTVNGTTFAWSALSYTVSDIARDTTLVVTFEDVPDGGSDPVKPQTYKVTSSVDGEGGTVSPSGETQVAEHGSLTLTFTPAEGYELASVSVDGKDELDRVSASGALRLAGIAKDMAVVASFKAKDADPGPSGDDYRTVSVSAGQGGSISPAGDVRVALGGSQSFTIVPEDGMRLASLTLTPEGGAIQNVTGDVAGGVYTIADVRKDCFLHAEFEAGEPDAGDVPETVFSVQAFGNTGGTVSPSGPVSAAKGSSLSFTFTPDEGFELERVEVTRGQDVSDVTAEAANGYYKLENIQSDVQVKATFAAKPAVDPLPSYYTVKASVEGGNGSVSPEGDVRVKAGASQTFLFTPADGYVLDRVTVDGAQVATDGYTYTLADVQKDVELKVSFREKASDEPDPVLPVKHTVSVQASPGGTVSPAGAFEVAEGSEPLFTFAPEAGYRLASVTLGGVDVTDRVVGGALRLAPVTSDLSLFAAFERVSAPEPPQADPVITATAGEGGSISPAGDVRVARGGSQTFSFIPEADYKVDRISIDGREFAFSGTSYTLFGVHADTKLHVEFKHEPGAPAPTVHTVSASATAGGQVSPEGDVSVVEGGALSVAFAPFEGYELYRVTVDGADLSAEEMAKGSYRFSDVRGEHALKAFFKQKGSSPVDPDEDPDKPVSYAVIQASAGPGGSIDPEGSVQVLVGSDQTFAFAPMEGYEVDQVLVDGKPVQVAGLSYTMTNVSASGTIAVTFKKGSTPVPVTHVITASAGVGGTIDPNGRVVVDDGADATFAIKADQGFELDRLEIDGAMVDASQAADGSYTFPNVRADHAIHAVFKAEGTEPVEPEYVVVHAMAGEGGIITPAGDTRMEKGGSLTLVMLPFNGFKLADVTVDGASAKDQLQDHCRLVLANIQAETSVVATFVEEGDEPGPVLPTVHRIQASSTTGGSISPRGTVQVVEGDDASFAVKAQEGYRLAKLVVDGGDVSADQVVDGVFSFTGVDADHSVRAVFERIPDGPAPEEPPYVNVDVSVKVSVSAGTATNGGGTVQPEFLTVPRGTQNLPFYVYPEKGHVLEQVLVNGVEVEFHQVETGAPRALSSRAAVFSAAAAPGVAGAYWFMVAEAPEDLVIDVTFRPLAEGEPAPEPVQMHRVSASATAGGAITPGGTSYVHDGGQVVFGVVSDEGYALTSVKVVQNGQEREAKDEVANGVLTIQDVRGNLEVRAEFAPEGTDPVEPEYVMVHATTDGNGAVSPSGDQRVKRGGSQTFSFAGNEGFTLDKVFVNNVETPVEGFSLTLANLVAPDTYVFATFRAVGGGDPQPVLHNVTVQAGTGGKAYPSGVNKVEEGKSLYVLLMPDEGYEVASVKANGVEQPKSAWEGGVYAVENVVGPVYVEVAFAKVAPPEPGKVLVTPIAGEHGSISPSEAKHYPVGSNIPFTFVPDEGYAVDQVIVNGKPVADFAGGTSYNLFNVTEDTVIEVTFKEDGGVPPVKTHLIKVSAGLHGSIVPAGDQQVTEGASMRFEFHPDEGYEVHELVVDGAKVENPGASYTFEHVTEGHSIDVSFKEQGTDPGPGPVDPTYFSITTSVAGGHGRISPEGTVQVEQGKARTFQFLPDAGYAVSSISIDGEKLDYTCTSYRFVDVQANHTLEVAFSAVTAPAPKDPVDAIDRTTQQAIGFVKTGDANGVLAASALALAAAAAGVALLSRRRALRQAASRDRARREVRR